MMRTISNEMSLIKAVSGGTIGSAKSVTVGWEFCWALKPWRWYASVYMEGKTKVSIKHYFETRDLAMRQYNAWKVELGL